MDGMGGMGGMGGMRPRNVDNEKYYKILVSSSSPSSGDSSF